MNNEYEADNGSRENVSEAKESSWPLSTIVRDVLVGFGAALVLLLAVGVGCEFALSRLDWRFDSIDRRFNQQDRRFNQQDRRFDQQDGRFDWQDRRFDQQDRRFDQLGRRFDRQDVRFDRQDRRMDRIESTTADGIRLSIERVGRVESAVENGFRQTHNRNDRTDARVDRLERKVYVIETFLDQGQLRMVVQWEESTPTLVFIPNAFGGTESLLPR